MTQAPPIGLEAPVVMQGLYESRFHEVTSDATGMAYRIFVGAPLAAGSLDAVQPGDQPRGQKYPAIYVLDGKLNFAMVHAQYQVLAALGHLPPAFVVGVAYAGDESFFENDAARRMQDLTPNEGSVVEAAMLGLNSGPAMAAFPEMRPGGAARFLDFLRDELRPALAAVYPVDEDDSTIVGNSLGGLFLSWVLFHEPSAFRTAVDERVGLGRQPAAGTTYGVIVRFVPATERFFVIRPSPLCAR